MAKLIDGKKIAAEVREDIRACAAEFTEKTGIVPGLAVIIVGEDPASKVYVRNKKKACVEAGFHSEVIEMPADTKMPELLSKIEELKQDDAIHGILVQLPLPAGLDEQAVIAAIPPEKDVDAFHVVNTGRIMLGDYDFLPCTPAGVMKLLEHEGVDVCGKECVVVGRSNIVGKPQAMLLLHANGTVTVCHSKTKKSCRDHKTRRHTCRSHRPRRFYHGRYDKARLSCDRRRNEPPRGRQALRRCRFRIGGAGRINDNPRSRRGRAYDHNDAA